jgi:Na+/melibiose symporter-like transporter
VAANLAGIVAAAVGGGILQLSPDPLPVLAAATAISLAGSIATFLIRYDDPLEPQQIAPPLRLASMAFRDRAFRRYLAAFTVLGFGNLMGATLYPLLLVDRFDAPNAFIGLYAATSAAATMIGFIVWGRLIDRGSSIALTVLNSAFLLLVPLVYMVAPSAIFLVPAAIVAGFTLAGGDLTFITNMVQLAPRGRAPEYMAAQSFALGIRGTLAPFVASALLLSTSIATTLLVVLFLAGAGTLLLRGVSARMEPRAEAEPLAEPASG